MRWGVSVFRCFGVSVFRCFSVSVFQCFGVSVFRCFSVSVFRCFSVSVLGCSRPPRACSWVKEIRRLDRDRMISYLRPPRACGLLIFGSEGSPLIRASAVFFSPAVARPVRGYDGLERVGRPSNGWAGAHSSYSSYLSISAAFSPLPAHIVLQKPISFFRLKAVQLHSHSWRTLSMPRNRNCRRFIHCLMNANCVSP